MAPLCTLKSTKMYNFIFLLSFTAAFLFSEAAAQCHSGWLHFQNSCYLFVNDPASWSGAMFDCMNLFDGYLAEIGSVEENNFLKQQARVHYALKPQTNGYWIGATDLEENGKFQWMNSKQPLTFKDWLPGEPNGDTRENCMHLYAAHDFLWNDSICANAYYFICEKMAVIDQVYIG